MLRPTAVDDSGFTVEPAPDGAYVVRGPRPERWVRQTNFDNEEAVGYLADRLARLGRRGRSSPRPARSAGDLVRIGAREFDWQPTLLADVSPIAGPRGTDARLAEKPSRISAAERLAARKARRVRREDEIELNEKETDED